MRFKPPHEDAECVRTGHRLPNVPPAGSVVSTDNAGEYGHTPSEAVRRRSTPNHALIWREASHPDSEIPGDDLRCLGNDQRLKSSSSSSNSLLLRRSGERGADQADGRGRRGMRVKTGDDGYFPVCIPLIMAEVPDGRNSEAVIRLCGKSRP